MSIETDGRGCPEPPIAGDEWETLLGFLDFHRATFAWKTSGLSQAQLVQTLGTSPMTLAGLIKHLTLVEDQWFREVLWAEEDVEPWASVEQGLDARSKATRHGETPNLRWIVAHMIEEYARHNGHVDLIRESIDGLTGN